MSMTGQQIYENFATAAGTDGLAEAQVRLSRVMEEYTALSDRIVKAAESLEEGWQGDAAGSAQRGAGPLAVEHARASEEMNIAQQLLLRQIDSFDLAKNNVVPVPPVPDAPSTMYNLFTLGSAQSRYDTQLAAAYEAERQNVAVMNLWANHSSYNERMMPTAYGSALVEPASITLDAPRPGGSAVDGGQGGGFDTNAPGSDATRTSGHVPPSVVPQPAGTGGVAPSQSTPPASAATPPGVTGPSGYPLPAVGAVRTEGATGTSGSSRGGRAGTGGAHVGPSTPVVGSGGVASTGAGRAGATAGRPTGGGVDSGRAGGRPFGAGASGGGTAGGPGGGQNLGAGRGSGTVPPGPAPGSTARPAGAPGAVGPRGMGGVPVVPGGGRGRNEDSEDHQRKYVVDSDDQFQLSEQGEKVVDPRTGLPTTPPVLGESRR